MGSRVLGRTLFAGMKVGEAFIRGSVSKVWEIRAASRLKGRCERGRMGHAALKNVLAALSRVFLQCSVSSFLNCCVSFCSFEELRETIR